MSSDWSNTVYGFASVYIRGHGNECMAKVITTGCNVMGMSLRSKVCTYVQYICISMVHVLVTYTSIYVHVAWYTYT